MSVCWERGVCKASSPCHAALKPAAAASPRVVDPEREARRRVVCVSCACRACGVRVACVCAQGGRGEHLVSRAPVSKALVHAIRAACRRTWKLCVQRVPSPSVASRWQCRSMASPVLLPAGMVSPGVKKEASSMRGSRWRGSDVSANDESTRSACPLGAHRRRAGQRVAARRAGRRRAAPPGDWDHTPRAKRSPQKLLEGTSRTAQPKTWASCKK